jgi:5-methylcytosine-specific restriction endonuclease McrA
MVRRRAYLGCTGEEWQKARMRALVRDGFQCQHPGCDETRLRYLEVHHRVERQHGGTHDLANLLTLCQEHHAAHHPHLARELERGQAPLEGYPWKEI